ncbi:NAC domain containing protein [Parasponia andersonii]|uniref:NAC domain containing protein n=1 Tax=Parasponia andersonii TaxID=3476 RepID=A0A2P5BKY6_PARAD|nr:NAC domain containing protein [Parasponia andersonii]
MSSKAQVSAVLRGWFKLHPTHKEIISYLKLKIRGMYSEIDSYIAEVDFCKCEPWELPSKSKMGSNNGEWFFLRRPDYKYANSNRSNRTTGTGYWKKTGPERKTKGCIGRKRVLVFYEGPPPGKRTDWVMHEYYFPQPDIPFRLQKPPYVFCHLKLKPQEMDHNADTPDRGNDEPSGEIMSDLGNPFATATIPVGLCLEEVDLESFFQSPHLLDSQFIEQNLEFLLDNEMEPPFEADKSEENFSECLNSLTVFPEENNDGTTTDNPFNSSGLSDSSKLCLNGPVFGDTNIERNNERYIRTWKLHAHLVHLLAQRKSSIRGLLKGHLKLYRLPLSLRNVVKFLSVCEVRNESNYGSSFIYRNTWKQRLREAAKHKTAFAYRSEQGKSRVSKKQLGVAFEVRKVPVNSQQLEVFLLFRGNILYFEL